MVWSLWKIKIYDGILDVVKRERTDSEARLTLHGIGSCTNCQTEYPSIESLSSESNETIQGLVQQAS